MAVKFVHRGSFKKLDSFLYRNTKGIDRNILEKYGWIGVQALANNTPQDSGKTASSWGFEIQETKKGTRISWVNSNIVDGVPIAILLQYGHATKNGGFVQGTDYINPAMKNIFEQLANEVWREVSIK